MKPVLPDVALNDLPSTFAPLDWVGMQHIDLPVRLSEQGVAQRVHAMADAQVDLPDVQVKGIHMSRLYRLLDSFAEHDTLTPGALAGLLENMVSSHADCGSTRARVRLAFEVLCRRRALVSEGLSGWKGYPVRLDAHWHGGSLQLDAEVSMTYSSTCPCSAALSRQVVQAAFERDFSAAQVPRSSVAQWLADHASAATPHSQRSVARIRMRIHPAAAELGLLDLIERAEAALGTPVQTAVKRADEQAFARLNGENLMYVEDASRRLHQALAGRYAAVQVFVSHQESLHAHDAVAWASAGEVRL